MKQLYEQLLRGTQEAEKGAAPMVEQCGVLESEVSDLQSKLESERAMSTAGERTRLCAARHRAGAVPHRCG